MRLDHLLSTETMRPRFVDPTPLPRLRGGQDGWARGGGSSDSQVDPWSYRALDAVIQLPGTWLFLVSCRSLKTEEVMGSGSNFREWERDSRPELREQDPRSGLAGRVSVQRAGFAGRDAKFGLK